VGSEEPVNRQSRDGDFIASRTALVSGGGNGIGRAVALELRARGARVIVAGRQREKLEAVSAELGGEGRYGVVDTASAESVAKLADALSDEDISILINNAGVAGPVAPLVDVSAAAWDDVFAVNVRGVFLMCKAFLGPMIAAERGDIINVASVTGKRPLAGRTPYAASKMAVLGLTITLAHEVGPLGIAVNSLSPGPVSGERMDRNFRLEAERTGDTAERAEQEFVSRSALRRMVTEQEVAAAVAAMLSMPGLCAADVDLSAGMVGR
jgi:NAD(P)-dependent dehydrogenase (short-subunit alcohol dehydrogenase family)